MVNLLRPLLAHPSLLDLILRNGGRKRVPFCSISVALSLCCSLARARPRARALFLCLSCFLSLCALSFSLSLALSLSGRICLAGGDGACGAGANMWVHGGRQAPGQLCGEENMRCTRMPSSPKREEHPIPPPIVLCAKLGADCATLLSSPRDCSPPPLISSCLLHF